MKLCKHECTQINEVRKMLLALAEATPNKELADALRRTEIDLFNIRETFRAD